MVFSVDRLDQNDWKQNSVFQQKGPIWQVLAYFIVIMFKTLGLAPWKLNFTDINRNSLLKKSCWGSAYNIFLIIVICSSNIYVLPAIYELKTTLTKIGITIDIGIIFLANITLISIWSLFIFRQKLIIIAYRKLFNADIILRNCTDYNLEINYRIPMIFFINYLFTMVSFIFGLCFYASVYVISWSIPTVIISWVLLQYSLILEMAQQRFRSINEAILKVGNVSKSSMSGSLFLYRFQIDESVLSQIVNMKYAFNELNNACVQVIDFFALPCLLCIIFFTATVIDLVYSILCSLVTGDWDYDFLELISDNAWFCVVTYSTFTLSTSVNNIVRELKQTHENIHYLLDLCTTEKVNKELLEFSQELLHQKIEFTPYNIINLDGSLLSVLSGKMIMYFLVLIQFDLMNRS